MIAERLEIPTRNVHEYIQRRVSYLEEYGVITVQKMISNPLSIQKMKLKYGVYITEYLEDDEIRAIFEYGTEWLKQQYKRRDDNDTDEESDISGTSDNDSVTSSDKFYDTIEQGDVKTKAISNLKDDFA
jgi:DNA-binding Lrp family transcriptional regulator